MRGYFGIALYNPKIQTNWGTILRTANILGASFISTIGNRYTQDASDTCKTKRHIPIFHFRTFEEFKQSIPNNCDLVGVELTSNSTELRHYLHPERACYLLGAEDSGIPEEIIKQCQDVIRLKGEYSLNVAVAGSIVLYHRVAL
jgi:tRNA G18 (ribose-2'-O)-methylase SpoU